MRSGYMEHLRADSSLEGQARLENVEELFNSIKEMEGELSGGEISALDLSAEEDPGLTPERESGPLLLEEFLEKISLMSAVDEGADSKEENNKVSLMTVHSAKGLEFPYVYVIGMEDNLFPSINGVSSDQEIEEERRLFYVALTRAKRAITLSYAQSRFRWGQQVNYPPSRFLKEVDRKFLNWPYEDGVMSIFRTETTSTSGLFSAREAFRRPASPPARGSASASPPASGPSSRAPLPPKRENFFPDPVEKLRVGMNVEHERFGYGKIILLEGDVLNMRAVVAFNDGGQKTLLLKFAKLRIVE